MIFPSRKDNRLFITQNTFPEEIATLRNKKKLAALIKDNCEEHPGRNLAQNSNVPRSQEDYRTQVSEEIEGRVTKMLSQEYSRTENRILGALVRLDGFLMNPLIQGYSGTAPETSRNAFSMNQRTNEDDSQSDPHPEAGIFTNQTTQNSGPEDHHDNRTEPKRAKTRRRMDIFDCAKLSDGSFADPSCLQPRNQKKIPCHGVSPGLFLPKVRTT